MRERSPYSRRDLVWRCAVCGREQDYFHGECFRAGDYQCCGQQMELVKVEVMRWCPECGVGHRYKETALSCLANIQNSYALDIIASEAGGGQAALNTPGARARKERLDRMEAYYNQLRGPWVWGVSPPG